MRVYEADGTWRMLDRVTSTQIGHIFARVTRAGEASRRLYGEKFNGFGGSQQSHLKFQIEETANADGNTNTIADADAPLGSG